MGLCELPRDLISSDEKGGTGGTCVLRGCVPKKLMALAGLFAEDVQDAASFGYRSPPAKASCQFTCMSPACIAWHIVEPYPSDSLLLIPVVDAHHCDALICTTESEQTHAGPVERGTAP